MRFASTACIGAQKKRIDINQYITWKTIIQKCILQRQHALLNKKLCYHFQG